MAQPPRALRLLQLLPLLLLLASCQRQQAPGPQQRAAAARAERDRLDLERCRRDQERLRTQVAALERTSSALAELEGRPYAPAPRPQPIDPALAERFSVADQELDSIRHQQAVERWQQEESSRYAAWLERHGREQQQLEEQLRQQRRQLKGLNSSLFEPGRPDRLRPAVVEKYSRCAPARFGIGTAAR